MDSDWDLTVDRTVTWISLFDADCWLWLYETLAVATFISQSQVHNWAGRVWKFRCFYKVWTLWWRYWMVEVNASVWKSHLLWKVRKDLWIEGRIYEYPFCWVAFHSWGDYFDTQVEAFFIRWLVLSMYTKQGRWPGSNGKMFMNFMSPDATELSKATPRPTTNSAPRYKYLGT